MVLPGESVREWMRKNIRENEKVNCETKKREKREERQKEGSGIPFTNLKEIGKVTAN